METKRKTKCKASEIDVYVGKKLKERMHFIDVTQERLAESIGVSFQQIQKYCSGKNRISAGKLFEISRALTVPVSYFFEGINSENDNCPSYSKDDMSFLKVYMSLDDRERKAVKVLAKSLLDAKGDS